MARVNGPDFICVGKGRAGTGWLYGQLEQHPDFWMPPVKEISYLQSAIPKMENAIRRLGHRRRRMGQPFDERDSGFVEEASACAGHPRDVARYATLFRFKGESLSGDITPTYAILTDETIADVAVHLPGVKIVLLVRDPVERAWATISMLHRGRGFDERLLGDRNGLLAFLKALPTLAERSQPTRVIDRWARVAPKLAFRHFFFDDLVQRPEWMRRAILTFLGADPQKKSGELPADHNRKAGQPKLALTDDVRAVLIEHYEDEIRAGAAVLGDHARVWAARYGL